MKQLIVFKTMSIFIIAAVLAACSPGNTTPTISPTEGVLLLAGEYTTTITEADLEQFDTLDPNLSELQGEWRLTFTQDGKFIGEREGAEIGVGNFSVKGAELEVYISSVCANCPCKNSIGRYKWALQDEQLYLVETAGICDLMHAVLTLRPLTRQE